jgi:hypothetical protein
MGAIISILPSVISLIPTITTGVENIIALVAGIRSAAQQTAEWTPELEKQFVDALIARALTKAWTPDSKL